VLWLPFSHLQQSLLFAFNWILVHPFSYLDILQLGFKLGLWISVILLEIMAAAVGRLMGTRGNSFLRRKNGEKKNLVGRTNVTVMASVAFPGMKEEYETLRLSTGATEKDVKSAFRRLALQHHPDVCKGDNCGVQFHKINQAYETVMSSLAQAKQQNGSDDYYMDGMMGINNDYCDEWEDWMGWEGAGTLDYSSHINIYA